MAMLRRKGIAVLLWLPALCSKFFLCVCHPVYACAVSMRVPVGFIPITVLISIDLLTVLVVVTPELLTNVGFFSIPLPEGESERDPKRGWRKKDQIFLFFHTPLSSNYSKILNLLQRWTKLQIAAMIFYVLPQMANNSCHAPYVLLSSHAVWTTI